MIWSYKYIIITGSESYKHNNKRNLTTVMQYLFFLNQNEFIVPICE